MVMATVEHASPRFLFSTHPISTRRATSSSSSSKAPKTISFSSVSSELSSSQDSVLRLNQKWQQSLLEYPYLSPNHSRLMRQLLSSFESHLGSQLLPSSLPPDVASFRNTSATSQGSIDIRYGHSDHSKVDFVLTAWLHAALPSGNALNTATIFGFLNSSTDVPHLLLEFTSATPTSLVLLLDLLPRKDLVLHPQYLQTFYEATHLDKYRKKLESTVAPSFRPFVPSSLYIRSIFSPTAVTLSIESDVMDEKLGGELGEVVKEVVELWLERCCGEGREVEEGTEKEVLMQRDYLISTKAVEADLVANMPRLFGDDVSSRVVEEIRKAFGTVAGQ